MGAGVVVSSLMEISHAIHIIFTWSHCNKNRLQEWERRTSKTYFSDTIISYLVLTVRRLVSQSLTIIFIQKDVSTEKKDARLRLMIGSCNQCSARLGELVFSMRNIFQRQGRRQ